MHPFREFRIYLFGGDHYSVGGGEQPIAASTPRAALESYCSGEWCPPEPGRRYEYAVQEVGVNRIWLFTVDPTSGYTITGPNA